MKRHPLTARIRKVASLEIHLSSLWIELTSSSLEGSRKTSKRVEQVIESLESKLNSTSSPQVQADAAFAKSRDDGASPFSSRTGQEPGDFSVALRKEQAEQAEQTKGLRSQIDLGEAADGEEVTEEFIRVAGEMAGKQLSRRAMRESQSDRARNSGRQPKTWRRVKAIPNTSRLMVGDREELDLHGMQVHVQVDGFRARVLVDYLFHNDHDAQLEGKFKIRLPDDASLYYFAFGQSAFDLTSSGELPNDEFLPERDSRTQFVSMRANDIRKDRQDQWRNVKEARMVPREKAAFAYGQTVRRRVDPALVEWSGAGVFNANGPFQSRLARCTAS